MFLAGQVRGPRYKRVLLAILNKPSEPHFYLVDRGLRHLCLVDRPGYLWHRRCGCRESFPANLTA